MRNKITLYAVVSTSKDDGFRYVASYPNDLLRDTLAVHEDYKEIMKIQKEIIKTNKNTKVVTFHE